MKNIILPKWEVLEDTSLLQYDTKKRAWCIDINRLIRIMEGVANNPHAVSLLKKKKHEGCTTLSKLEYEQLTYLCEEEEDNIPPKK